MLILRCSAQLQRLEEALRKSLPLTLPVYGAVMNINRGNPGEYEVVVDSWPNFGAVLARRRGEVLGVLGSAGSVGHWGEPSVIGGKELEALGGTGGPGGHWEKAFGCWGHSLVHWGLDPGVRVASLSPAHADLLNETWPYGGNHRSRGYLVELLGRFPHVSLQDSAGQPLSWVLTDQFGTGAHGYTLPTHRQRGYMQAALVLAARRAQERGFPTFG
ncbi:GLYL3 protein, partial [Eurystomus gularis]|nr:GLYL3 protein [Eurystomus gularis]